MTPKIQPIRASLDALTRMHKIDEYGEVKRRLQLSEPDKQRAELLKDEIEGWHKGNLTAVPITERGLVYEIQLSAKRNERTVIDKRKAFARMKRALGLDGLIAILDIGLGAIDKAVPESEQAAFMSSERSGYRTFTVVAIAPASAEALKAA